MRKFILVLAVVLVSLNFGLAARADDRDDKSKLVFEALNVDAKHIEGFREYKTVGGLTCGHEFKNDRYSCTIDISNVDQNRIYDALEIVPKKTDFGTHIMFEKSIGRIRCYKYDKKGTPLSYECYVSF